jgi:hypothetical protein
MIVKRKTEENIMKWPGKLILIAVTGLSVCLPIMLVAQGRNGLFGYGGSNFWRQGFRGTGGLLLDEMDSIRVDILSEITHQPMAKIREDLENKPFLSVLDEYEVELNHFQPKMNRKAALLIKKTANDGKITREQEDRLLKKMRPGRGKIQSGRAQGTGCGKGWGCDRNCRWSR